MMAEYVLFLLVLAVPVLVGVIVVRVAEKQQKPAGIGYPISQSLDRATQANVRIQFGIGTLRLGEMHHSRKLIEGSANLGDMEWTETEFEKHEHLANYTLKSKCTAIKRPAPGPSGHKGWDLRLNADIPMDLKIGTGVGSAILDLEGLKVTRLEVNASAANTILTLPARGIYEAVVDGGISDLTIHIPEGTAAHVNVSTDFGSELVFGNFRLDNDAYVSPGYDTSANRVDLLVRGGVSRILVRGLG